MTSQVPTRSTTFAGLAMTGLLAVTAAHPNPAKAEPPAAKLDPALEARMDAEAQARRACKVKICDIAHNKKAAGKDIACDVHKTWTAEQLKNKILKGRLGWPWGHAHCKAKVQIARQQLSKLLSGAQEITLDKHAVTCELTNSDGKGAYTINFSIKPKVVFKDGKATKASLNWSDITGSALAQGAVWSAAKLDNNLGVLEGATVAAINTFFGESCDDVKDQWTK